MTDRRSLMTNQQTADTARTEQLTAALREVLATFAPMHEVHGGPVSYYDGSADIEAAQFEKWRATLDDVDLPAGFKRTTAVTVDCAACGYHFDETEFIHAFDSIAEATSTVVGAGWDELEDGRVICEEQDEAHEVLRSEVGVVDQDATEGAQR
jgi:hypothetical protein